MLDEKALRTKLREMDMSAVAGATASLSLEDLARQISETKAKARAEKEAKKPKKPYVPPGGWKKKEDMNDLVPPKQKPDPIEKGRKMVTIDKYRTLRTPRVWDSAMTVSGELEKTLYRKGGGDTSGKRIFNLGRDAYPKDIPSQWKPGQCDNDFGTPSLELVTDSFRTMLTKHVSGVPPRVAQELKTLPEFTTNDRNLKSRMAADLSKVRLAEKEVITEFERLDRLEKERKSADATHWDFSLKKLVPNVTLRQMSPKQKRMEDTLLAREAEEKVKADDEAAGKAEQVDVGDADNAVEGKEGEEEAAE